MKKPKIPGLGLKKAQPVVHTDGELEERRGDHERTLRIKVRGSAPRLKSSGG
jgi:hypothetical protein